MHRYRSRSLWLDTLPDDPLEPRPPLDGDVDADVAIVGAGYTGLWTAYYLLRARPDANVVVLDAEIAGFGASGRNGGWCSALFAAGHAQIAKRYGRASARAMHDAMVRTVDEVGRVCREESIDCAFHKGGTLTLVTSPTQTERVKAVVEAAREWGLDEHDLRWLDPSEVAERITIADCGGAAYTPHCARLQPAALVRGLARVVEGKGATIYERTRARTLRPREIVTERGTVRASVVIRATEGYSTTFPGLKRALVPLYSLMIATEPLSKSTWDEIGWRNAETITDGRHLLIYAQRTADDRVAIGGRGAPYHYGSRVDDRFDRVDAVHEALAHTLARLFPAAADAAITHRWGGPVGVPRDWFSSVGFDPSDGIGWAGGYVGDGVSTANLAGRTLADLVTGRATEVTKLPWVQHRSRRWEIEPFRWLGINLAIQTMASADAHEARTGRPTKRGTFVKRLVGI